MLQMKNGSSQNISNRQPRFSMKDMNKDRSLADVCRRINLNHSSEVGLRYCYKIQNSCKDTADNSTTARGCRDGNTALVSFMNETYKNFYCLKCNHRYSFGFIPAQVSCGPHNPPDTRFNFATMFRFPVSLHTDTARCSPGFFYDNTARICRKLLTISELNLNDSSFLTSYAIRLHYTRNQKLKCFGYNVYNKNPTKDNKTVILGKLLSEFNEAFLRIIELNLRNTNWTLSNIAIHVDDTNYTTVTFQILAIKSERNETELFSPVKDLQLGQINFFYNRYNASSLCSYSLSIETSRKMKCLDTNQSNVAITMDKVSIFDNGTLYHQASGEKFNQGEYMLFKRRNQTRLATCAKSVPTNCKYILKSDSNWKLFSNRSIYSNVTNTWFEFGEYSIIDGVVWLCLTDELSPKSGGKEQSKTVHETILRYSSLFCLSISILSLIVLLFIYAITPALRNLPGKNLMLLCCVLALAQFLWLLQERASELHKLCVILSTLLHFMFLATFSCATSIASLSFFTFRAIANGKLGRSNEGKAFLRCALFSLGFPCVWITLFFLLDYYRVFLLDYGSVKGHCWLGNIDALYVSFFAPVFTLLCINLALLLATVKMIRKCSKSSQKLAESGSVKSVTKSHVWIYIRMASLMGFTWLLGVFQLVFPRVLVFEYLFVFVNGFQGFYIALAFLCTDNVKKILSKRTGSDFGKTRSTSK